MANPLRQGRFIAAVAALLLASAGPPALASSGGTSAPGTPAVATPTASGLLPSAGFAAAMPATPGTLQAPVGGALVGQPTTIRGRLQIRDSNRPVLLEYFDAKRGWTIAARGRTNSLGAFALVMRPTHIGRFIFRATSARATSATASATTPTPIEIYRPVLATIFGSGDYGSRTACGQALTPVLLGVAHRTLPCGTPVDITYGSHTITVPVVDRGPYVGGVSYDLTSATATALGIDETAQIGALAIRGAAPVTP